MSEWLLTLLAASLIFLVPGWALLRLWAGADQLTLAEQAGLAIGIGMAIPPLLIMLTGAVGLQLGPLYAWLPPLLATPLLIWTFRRRPAAARAGWRTRERGGNLWPNLALLVVLTAIVWARCAAVDGLEVPLWGDSLHHTMIVQLMLDHGGLFRSWEPYAAMQSFTYHFGFHSQVAALAWMTGVATPRAVLLGGQIDNIAAVFALYPLALRLGKTRWAGVAALLLAGLLTAMPMYYVSWGRYTQLAGQAIMPAGIYLAWEFLSLPRRSWALLGLSSATLAGMALTHYRIAIFAGCFFPAFAVLEGLRLPWRQWVWRGAQLGLVAGALALPWFVRILGGKLIALMLAITAAAAPSTGGALISDTIESVGELSFYLPTWIWYAIPLSIFWAIWRRARAALLVALWWALVTVVVNPQWLALPGSGTLTNFALVIAAYIPASLLVGAAVGWLLRKIRSSVIYVGVTLAVCGLAWWGGSERLKDITPEATAMVTPADLQAAGWIAQHTPADARFLINGFFPNSAAVVGSDAGWWLPLIARRQTVLPPLLYISEQGPRPDYREWVNQVYASIYAEGVGSPAALDLLRARGVGYVYLGEHQGRVGFGGSPALTPETLLASPAFRLVYHQDQVWIFALGPG